jgi:hypothetical protein
MKKILCPKCGKRDAVWVDDFPMEGGPEEGWIIFPATCGDPYKSDEKCGHMFRVKYILSSPETYNY